MELPKTCIESGLSTSRKAHQNYALGIDPWMRRENVQRTIDIEHKVKAAKQFLVCAHLRKPATRKAIERKSRDADRVKFFLPHLDVGTHSA